MLNVEHSMNTDVQLCEGLSISLEAMSSPFRGKIGTASVAGKPGHLLVPSATACPLVHRAAAAERTARRSAFVIINCQR